MGESEVFYGAQLAILEQIAASAPLASILELIVLAIEARADGMLCSILLLDPDARCVRHGAAPSLPASYTQLLDGATIGPGVGSCGTAAFEARPVVVTNISEHPYWLAFREVALAHGLRACWSTPIYSDRHDVLGTFAMYYQSERGPSNAELRWVDTATHLASIAISRDRENAERRRLIDELQSVHELAGVGGWVVDVPTRRLLWSPQLFALHEMPPGESPAFDQALATCAPEFRDTARAMIDACLTTGKPFDTEVQLITSTGRRVWVRAIGRAQRDASGAIVKMHGAMQDIDERRRLADDLRQAQKMEAIGQLAAGVAHDFNNLLSVMLSYSAFVLDRLPEDDLSRGDVEEIQRAGLRAADLTRQLLAFSRKQPIAPAKLDLGVVVTEMDKMLCRLVGDDVQLEVVHDSLVDAVLADRGQIEQVIVNLVVNARDAMPNGGKITIELTNTVIELADTVEHREVTPGPYVMVRVTDTGTGMDAATVARIFEPFFTTKTRGTGLGLSTAYGIVGQSGGHIRVRSRIGIGTTFRVYLPRFDGDAAIKPASAPIPLVAPRSETILVVEDSDPVRAIARTALRSAGYHVLEAQNGELALRLCDAYTSRIDLLLTDVSMPLISGRELAQRITSKRPEIRVLYMSGYADPHVTSNADEESFLAKPITPSSLLAKTRAVLDAAPAAARAGRILHVDDEDSLVVLTARILERNGYQVTGFTDPVAALLEFETHPSEYYAIVSDVSMPGMTGFDLVRAVRRIQPHIPIVITSGCFRADDVREAEELGLQSLVVKPNTVADLARALHDELRRAHTS